MNVRHTLMNFTKEELMIVPGTKVLIEILPFQSKPGMVMDSRAEQQYKGKVIEMGAGVDQILKYGDIVYFRFHFGYLVPETSPELMVIDYQNIELIRKE